MKKFITATMALLITTFCGLQLCVHKESLVINEKTAQTDIIKAINLYGKINHKIKIASDKVHTCDITKINKLSIQYDYKKNTAFFNYNVNLYQASNQHKNYLTSENSYRQPEVNGTFSITLDSQTITNNEMNINFLSGIYSNNCFQDTDDILVGNTNDFYLILNQIDWSGFKTHTLNDKEKYRTNKFLSKLRISNQKINITDKSWTDIIYEIGNYKDKTLALKAECDACFHIKWDTNLNKFYIVYSNLENDIKNDILFAEYCDVPLFAFQDNETNNYQQHYWFNQSILSYLNDIYHDKTKFHDDNWNLKGIESFLINNQLVTTNLKIEQVAATIIKLFEKYETNDNQAITHLIQQLYYSSKTYSGVLLSFDKNQNLILNHAALGEFIKNNKPAIN